MSRILEVIVWPTMVVEPDLKGLLNVMPGFRSLQIREGHERFLREDRT